MGIGGQVYRTVLRGARAAAPLLASGSSKVARGLRGRMKAVEDLIEWGRRGRDPGRPTVWFHAPSVGEGMTAGAVMEALRDRRPSLQLVYTYFSPSAVHFADRVPADVRAYLPWDLPERVGPVLDALEPRLLAFTKTEVWPELIRAAEERGVPSVLVGATLPPGAGRLRWPARAFLRPTFGRLQRVAAISDDDAGRFGRLGVPPVRIVVSGDPGIDSAARRVGSADPTAAFMAPFHDDPRPTLVAGSTWPPDEDVVLPAATRIRNRRPELRLVVAPHEPDAARVESLMQALDAGGWRTARLARVEEEGSVEDAEAVVVDRVGVLARLYTIGSVAYVGGGFGDDGLHSVLEPAAAAVPVLFGPHHRNARAAGRLLEGGGAVEVADARGLAGIVVDWLDDDDARRAAGRRARAFVDGHRGAAERCAELVLEVMEGR